MVLEGACIFLNKKQHYQHHQHLSTYMWNENIKPIAHDAYLSIFTLHLKLPTQTAKKNHAACNPIPDLPSWITTLPWNNHQFCVFIHTYFHVTPSKREQMLPVCSSRKKGKHTIFMGVTWRVKGLLLIYNPDLYEFYIYIHRISLKITGHASSGFLRRGAAPRYGLVMSEWKMTGSG